MNTTKESPHGTDRKTAGIVGAPPLRGLKKALTSSGRPILSSLFLQMASQSSAGMIRPGSVPCSISMSEVFPGSTRCLLRAAYGGCGGMRLDSCNV